LYHITFEIFPFQNERGKESAPIQNLIDKSGDEVKVEYEKVSEELFKYIVTDGEDIVPDTVTA
jgi:hypothetical protein